MTRCCLRNAANDWRSGIVALLWQGTAHYSVRPLANQHMEPLHPSDVRLQQLVRSPGGCALLIIAAAARLTPAEIVEPVTALHLVSSAVGELSPWRGDHGWFVEKVRHDAANHVQLAEAIVREPGIEHWWAPLDRDTQVWIEPESRDDFPETERFPIPADPPTRHEIYAQFPERRVTTSTQVQGLTSQEATIFTQWSDWYVNYPARRKHVQVAPNTRI
jgi:hypothetical protein